MQRRDVLKGLVLGPAAALSLSKQAQAQALDAVAAPTGPLPQDSATRYASKWHRYFDMPWTGEDLWAQRLQDWCVRNGELQCLFDGPNRTMHVLTHQLGPSGGFVARTRLRFVARADDYPGNDNRAGFRLGIQGRFRDDYRSAVITGKGIDAGVTRDGRLFVDKHFASTVVDPETLATGVTLELSVDAGGAATLRAHGAAGQVLATVQATPEGGAHAWAGNVALLSHFKPARGDWPPVTVAFASFDIRGEQLVHHPQQVFGGIYFAQYTVHEGTLKLSAQLAPFDRPDVRAELLIGRNGQWRKVAEATVHPLARVAAFRVRDWNAPDPADYKVRYVMPLQGGGTQTYEYAGRIAAEPGDKARVRALLCSCNWDLGFPDHDAAANMLKQKADLAMFVGDQFYESNGGFGTQMFPLEKSVLDYLRKWIQFGWSYRDVFRDIPSIYLLDDHDMYHGNIWGCGGRPAVQQGDAADVQDSGGYKMPAEWVNMAQLAQTSHMPDPYDPDPVRQGIKVYYTHWEYAGISFGIVEDRKFKSAPKDILPASAQVWNGYAQNPGYDKDKTHWLEAQLLGERQMQFLDHWSHRWNRGTAFKVLVSATPLCCLQTLPAGAKNDDVTPDLPIPPEGVYVTGDEPTRDMDTNGWPQNRRDDVLKLLRKNFTLHMTGDQHMASVVQYGVEEYGDSGFAFTSPALTSIWPRRWWPPIEPGHRPIPGQPAYTGNFKDGFGNRMTVHAVANPRQTGRTPALLYDRASGYSVVDFDKSSAQATMHCWPRYVDPVAQPDGQYNGWPITIDRADNFRSGKGVSTAAIALDPSTAHFVRVVDARSGELVCQANVQASQFRPPLEHAGPHTVHITSHADGTTRSVDIEA